MKAKVCSRKEGPWALVPFNEDKMKGFKEEGELEGPTHGKIVIPCSAGEILDKLAQEALVKCHMKRDNIASTKQQ